MTREELFDMNKIEGMIHIPVELLGQYPSEDEEKAKHFVMTADGNGMVNAGINNGDTMVFREVATAPSDAVVAVLMDGELACRRRYIKVGKKVRFRREDGVTPDRKAKKYEILGVLVTVVHKYNYCG